MNGKLFEKVTSYDTYVSDSEEKKCYENVVNTNILLYLKPQQWSILLQRSDSSLR